VGKATVWRRKRSAQVLRFAQDDILRYVTNFMSRTCGTRHQLFQSFLLLPTAYYVEHQRQQDADHDGGGEWKIESGVLASIEDVAGQAAQRKVGAPEEGQQKSRQQQNYAECYQKFPEIVHWKWNPAAMYF
jgi:hypothetical protein